MAAHRLVELVRNATPEAGLWGAKITGSDSDGTVSVLARRGSKGEVRRVAERYGRETGRDAVVLGGSSSRAEALGPCAPSTGNRGRAK